MKIIKSFRRGAWETHIVETTSSYGPSIRVRLDHPNGYNTDWPVKYDNGKIGYDMWNPPRDAQRATRAAYRELEGCNAI